MKIVALVLAGGEGSRLYPLTAEHSKPALPFANGYRIVDFVLSNLVNSKISTIYVVAQYKPDSLMRHIAASWAPWLNAPGSVIKVLLRLNRQSRGTADAVHQCLTLQAHSPDVVAIFAATTYRMDVRQMIDFHCARGRGSVAMVVAPSRAASFGIISARADGRAESTRSRSATEPARPGAGVRVHGNHSSTRGSFERALERASCAAKSISAATCCRGSASSARLRV
jgi:glucose-1-phosphate adenylyltransferase